MRRVSGCGARCCSLASTVHRGRASTCRAASAGFWRCMTRRPKRLRGCPMYGSGSPPFALFGRGSKRRSTLKLADTPTDALAGQRASRCAVSGDSSRSQFGAAGVRAHWLAGAADDSEQPREDSGGRELGRFRASDVGDAHGLAAPYRRKAEERLPLFHRPRLQQLSYAAGGLGPVEAGTARASGARCPAPRIRARLSPTSTIPT